MIDKTISHYKIIDKLGEGGMGEVYLAEDTKLNRQVALKLLPTQLASDGELKERFKREAQAAAALNHPNIITIHEVAEYEARPFIAMEYVEGESLKDLIARKELSIGEVLDVALQISGGLAVAHQAGIIHRDIKPQNILMGKDGRVRICDFGLAKAKRDVTLTQTGSTLGTVAYMSPEQAQGKEVDHRSDIFSLGVVLYEMMARRLPFKGEHEAAMIHAIVNDTPEPLARYKAGVPAGLQRIVDKSLKKDVATRYQSAAEMVSDLKELQQELGSTAGIRVPRRKAPIPIVLAGIGVLVLIATYAVISLLSPPGEKQIVAERKMLAVLPFENSGSAEDEYFADGITDEITSRLAKLSGLGVISRTSSIRYKDTDKSLPQIAQELGVGFILEGTIRWDKSGETDRVRITPRLIKVSDNTHLWAENYGRSMSDIFAVQAEIATQIAEALDVNLLKPERDALEEKPTENLDAYHAYLRGYERLWGLDYSEENLNLAVMMLERATELDPDFALAYAALSDAHSMTYHMGFDRAEERLARAKEALDRALILQPKLPEAHLAYGDYYYMGYRNYEKALQEYAIAQKSLPNYYRPMFMIGTIYKREGRFEEALDYYKGAVELSPHDPVPLYELGLLLVVLRDYPAAERYLDRSISLAPDQTASYGLEAYLYWAWNGDLLAARATLEKAPGRAGNAQQWWTRYFQEFYERDYRGALSLLASIPSDMFELHYISFPKIMLAAECYRMMDKAKLAHAAYDSARTLLEANVTEMPDDYRYRLALGWAYAGLDRKDEAIREGKLAVELMPVSKDALLVPELLEELARTYIMVGEYEAALDEIDYLLSIPSWLSVSLLRIDPRYDPLRDNPRFQALLEKYDTGNDTGK